MNDLRIDWLWENYLNNALICKFRWNRVRKQVCHYMTVQSGHAMQFVHPGSERRSIPLSGV